MSEEPSTRLIEQRLRNRILECFEYLAEGDQAARHLGFKEYFELFFDQFPYEGDWALATLNAVETEASINVLDIMRTALTATPPSMTAEDFIKAGWPERIRPVAAAAVETILKRGRSDEEAEEVEPSPSNLQHREA